ncbi:MAG: transposase [Firmicutes bacterium]|nr:transposase [Bacillota bacterium]
MSQHLSKWKHFESEIIILCIRWYLKYPLSYRMIVEMMQERGLKLTHTTIMRWVHQYSPIIDKISGGNIGLRPVYEVPRCAGRSLFRRFCYKPFL